MYEVSAVVVESEKDADAQCRQPGYMCHVTGHITNVADNEPLMRLFTWITH
jgi:hypothetical protein